MRKILLTQTSLLLNLTVPLFFIILLITINVLSGCTNASGKEENSGTKLSANSTTTTALEGNWVLVWSKENGVIQNHNKPSQFKTFHDGYFSMIAWDSSGKFSYAGYGKYELQDKNYKETMIYHSSPEYISGYDLQEWEVKGDTLYFKGFDKVVVGGKDVTADFGKIEEKRVRVK